MGGPGSGPRGPRLAMSAAWVDPLVAKIKRAQEVYYMQRGRRMDAVRQAQHRETCLLHSRRLWRTDGVMLPLVLERWGIPEDEVREAGRRPQPEGEPFTILNTPMPRRWTRPVP